jgi:ribosome-binding factor A
LSHHRSERLADQVHQILARLLREEVRDPSVGFVTITEVKLSSDLRHARIFVSAITDAEECLEGLKRAAPFLRRGLASKGGLRFTPELRFLIDESVAGGFRIQDLLDDVVPGDEADEADES